MKEAGLIEYTELGAGQAHIVEKTAQCCHCGKHFTQKPLHKVVKPLTELEARVAEKEGKTIRGFCQNCNGPVCGPNCVDCVPMQQMLENLANGIDRKFRPIMASVPRAI